MAANRVIGLDGTLPWRLPADLKHFKRVTMHKPVVMGRKTWESLQVKPLPGRQNIVLTRNSEFRPDETTVVHTFDDALHAAAGESEVMVIGGEQIYRLALPRANRLYLTEVHESFQGDARFPELDPEQWRELSREAHRAEADAPAHSFVVLERVELEAI